MYSGLLHVYSGECACARFRINHSHVVSTFPACRPPEESSVRARVAYLRRFPVQARLASAGHVHAMQAYVHAKCRLCARYRRPSEGHVHASAGHSRPWQAMCKPSEGYVHAKCRPSVDHVHVVQVMRRPCARRVQAMCTLVQAFGAAHGSPE